MVFQPLIGDLRFGRNSRLRGRGDPFIFRTSRRSELPTRRTPGDRNLQSESPRLTLRSGCQEEPLLCLLTGLEHVLPHLTDGLQRRPLLQKVRRPFRGRRQVFRSVQRLFRGGLGRGARKRAGAAAHEGRGWEGGAGLAVTRWSVLRAICEAQKKST